MKLIKLIKRIREINLSHGSPQDKLDSILKYANFLEQSLELWMFIPCDKDGNMLKKPKNIYKHYSEKYFIDGSHSMLNEQYKDALNKVFFKGVIDFFELKEQKGHRFYTINSNQIFNIYKDGSNLYWHFETIEDLCELGLELTTNVKKTF